MDLDFTPEGLLSSLLVSSIGFSLFLYGKKQIRIPQLATGIAMMAYPLFITGALAMLSIGALLIGGMWLAVRSGA